MNYTKFGQAYTTEKELCDLLYLNPELDLTRFLVEDPGQYNQSREVTFSDFPILKRFVPIVDDQETTETFDQTQQSNWYMPDEYKQLDIAQWLLDQCKGNETKLQRVGKELLLYQERNLFSLLQYLKYFVDTMRSNGVVWGLGRGSSVASYVLYLIGVHKIDSIYYGLEIEEFLR